MAYSSFTLDAVQEAFHLEVIDTARVFADIEPMQPSELLTAMLARHIPLAIAIGTEKARAELIVAGVLAELREQLDLRISFFSGIDFNVDADASLVGVCDFLVSLSPRQSSLKAPVIVLVEAKKEDLIGGLGQCAAEMVAAQRFNAEKGNDIPCIYGAITSGVEWLFLKLERQKLYIDLGGYTIERCDRILGILASMVAQTACGFPNGRRIAVLSRVRVGETSRSRCIPGVLYQNSPVYGGLSDGIQQLYLSGSTESVST